MSQAPSILVIDIGSSSVRALLFDAQAQLVPGAVVARPHAFLREPSGASIIDARELRVRVESCIDDLLTHPAAASISAVGMDTFVGNVLGLDAAGSPLTPVFTYADTRSAEDAARLAAEVDSDTNHQRTGCLLHSAYLPAQFTWLRRTQPNLFAAVTRWTDVGTYLYESWFGSARESYSVASWSGLLNRADLSWDAEWLARLELSPAALPHLGDIDHLQTDLLPAYAERWPQLRDALFCLPVGDGAAANVGAGCVTPSHVALTVGTTAALRTITDTRLPHVPSGLWSYRVDAKLHLIGGATSEGGSVFRWLNETLALGDAAAFEAELARRPADAHGLTLLPLFGGERSPGWAADATGVIVGLRFSTTPLDILQAGLEAVALRLALVAEQLESAAPNAQFIASGGAVVASPVWAQIITNALNRPIHVTEENELTARGTALLVLRAMAGTALDAYPPTIARVLEPQPQAAAALAAARVRQVRLYKLFTAGDE
jgi:gluconokinase